MKQRMALFLGGIFIVGAIALGAAASNLHFTPATRELPANQTLLAGELASNAAAQTFPGDMNFQGRYLAVLSDADMVASAYVDGDLGPRTPNMRDELAIVPLDSGLPGEIRRIPVSNAVTAWPSLLVLSEDGRFAYVAETDGPAPRVQPNSATLPLAQLCGRFA